MRTLALILLAAILAVACAFPKYPFGYGHYRAGYLNDPTGNTVQAEGFVDQNLDGVPDVADTNRDGKPDGFYGYYPYYYAGYPGYHGHGYGGFQGYGFAHH